MGCGEVTVVVGCVEVVEGVEAVVDVSLLVVPASVFCSLPPQAAIKNSSAPPKNGTKRVVGFMAVWFNNEEKGREVNKR